MYDEEKFAGFNAMLEELAADTVVVVADPSALGDDYEELVENLWRIANKGFALRIVPKPEASR